MDLSGLKIHLQFQWEIFSHSNSMLELDLSNVGTVAQKTVYRNNAMVETHGHFGHSIVESVSKQFPNQQNWLYAREG